MQSQYDSKPRLLAFQCLSNTSSAFCAKKKEKRGGFKSRHTAEQSPSCCSASPGLPRLGPHLARINSDRLQHKSLLLLSLLTTLLWSFCARLLRTLHAFGQVFCFFSPSKIANISRIFWIMDFAQPASHIQPWSRFCSPYHDPSALAIQRCTLLFSLVIKVFPSCLFSVCLTQHPQGHFFHISFKIMRMLPWFPFRKQH